MTALAAPRAAPAATPRVSERRWNRVALAAAIVLALALRVPFARIPFGPDEGGLSFIAGAWGHGHGSLYGAYWVDRPPLLLALFKLAIQGGPLGVRALGAVAAVALVVLAFHVARMLRGARAGRVAALLTAVLTGSSALTAVFTPAELLASVPAAGSVAALLAADRSGRVRLLAVAGLLAVCAALIKQSFLDAGFAGVTFLAATAIHDRRGAVRRAGAYAAGALVPLAAVAVWQVLARVPAGALPYALFGFRIDALRTLSASSLPLHVRIHALRDPAVESRLVYALAAALPGPWLLRRDRVATVTMVAWLAAGAVGVLGGGSYWPHYLIQIVVPVAVLAGTSLAAIRPWVAWPAVLAVLALSAKATVQRAEVVHARPPHRREAAVAAYVRAHARPGDTQYVLYARANLEYAIGLPSPYPYAWSLLVRGIPGAPARLLHLLRSPRRPTWVVVWQPPRTWGLDPHHAIARALRHDYRRVDRVGRHPIYHRRTRVAAAPAGRTRHDRRLGHPPHLRRA